MSTEPRSRHCGKPREVLIRISLLGITKQSRGSDFLKTHPEYLAEGNAMDFISDNGGEEYNLCHCELPDPVLPMNADVSCFAVWSNFEIADMDFWRAPAYTAYVDYLEATGGFYYEVGPGHCFFPQSLTYRVFHQRWGDAPVHSIGVALFAKKDQIHFFDEIGYEHAPYQHCPREKKSWQSGSCGCNPSRSFGTLDLIFITITIDDRCLCIRL